MLKAAGIVLFLVSVLGCSSTKSTKIADQKESDTYYKLGMAYLSENPPKLQKAYVEFLKSTEKNPTNAEAQYALGHVYFQRQEYEKAIEIFKKILTLTPRDSKTYNYLGKSYEALDRDDEAITAYREALRDLLYETPQLPHWNLGFLYLKRKWYDQALLEFQEVRRIEPDNIVVIHQIGETYLEMGQPVKAGLLFEEATQIAPEDYRTHDRLARFYMEMGSLEKAQMSFQKVMQLAPKDSEAEANKAPVEPLK